METQITDAGCASLVAALNGGVLPALEDLEINNIPADGAARAALEARFPPADPDDSDDSDGSEHPDASGQEL